MSHETLYDHGAVSEPTALEMARDVRRTLGADVGVAITGIAGPGGGMPGKPVGLVFVALSALGVERCEKHNGSGGRAENKEQSALAALRLLLRYLEGGS
ncbi:MAG: CinA family protein [Anaerolineae bacterium]